MENQNELLFWVWLSERLGEANRDFRNVMELYQTPYEVFCAESRELESVKTIQSKTAERLSDKDLHRATEILEACEKQKIGILTYADVRFPKNLREVKTAPVLLYYRGILPDLNRQLCIGMVGTRKMSAYGLHNAYRIAYELSVSGVITVSGMAAGVDGVCAAASLSAGAPTIAVLGCGVDVVYPHHHATLMNEIIKTGAVISEYAPGTLPNGYHFPTRNRIISGMTSGTVVVEAGVGSGSLITARDAVMQGRDVFALPSNLENRKSEGTNELLHDGARLALSAEDILEPYRFVFPEALHPERIASAKDASTADLQYLHRIGVIELTKREEQKSAPKAVKASSRRESPEKEPEPKEEAPIASEVFKKETPPLTPVQKTVLDAMPDGENCFVDTLLRLPYPAGDVIASLTMLEIMGLIRKMPGAQYRKMI